MKERPIHFKTEMVKAILEGRKTMTRIMIKKFQFTEKENGNDYCPFGKVGDVLWVKETFAELEEADSFGKYLYKSMDDTPEKWKSSLFMPKEAARIWLEITDIKVERLQDISEEDAISEGIEHIHENESFKDYLGEVDWYGYSVNSFQSLWQSINGEESWNSNPFVWVIKFKKIKP